MTKKRNEMGQIQSSPDSYVVKLSIRVTQKMNDQIMAIAQEVGSNKTEWCRDAIEKAVEEYEDKVVNR